MLLTMRRLHAPPLLLSLAALVPAVASAQQTCYGTNGTLITDRVGSCNPNAPDGVHVACCDLGKSPPDMCIEGGLCYRQDGENVNALFYADGCTDETGEAAACQQFCRGGEFSPCCSHGLEFFWKTSVADALGGR